MEETRAPKAKWRSWLWIAVGIASIAVVATAVGAYYHFSQNRLRIPAKATQGVSFPLYIPKKLPAGYAIDTASFQYVPAEGVFLFRAADDADDALVFSEQRKPSNVNFADFADKQLMQPKKLPNLPFSTTVGKTLDKQTTLVSIVTPETWVTVTTQAELDNQQLRDVAAGMSKY